MTPRSAVCSSRRRCLLACSGSTTSAPRPLGRCASSARSRRSMRARARCTTRTSNSPIRWPRCSVRSRRSSRACANSRCARADVEMARMLTQAEAADARGEALAEWMWQEDAARVGAHDPSSVRTPDWIMYADVVNAHLEEKFREYQVAPQTVCPIVEIDLEGKVRSTTTMAKAFAANTGTGYEIDFAAMKQKNRSTGHARKIQRQVKNVAWAAPHDGGGNARTMALREVAVTAHEDALTLPADLLADETASLLLIKVGMLVQVQTKRADGWWFGFALESARADADGVFGEESGASLPEAATVDEMIAALARFSGVKYVDRGYLGGGASRAEIARAAAERLGVPPNASETYVASRAHVAELYRALREWRATDKEECGAGWFPASHVGEPTPNQIQRITDLLSRRENGVISGAASDALA